MNLYSFEKLSKRLDELGFPIVIGESDFQIIKGIDFEEAFKAGSITFKHDGIYLEYKGKSYKGYMFIKFYDVMFQGYENFPKFHLKKCRTIREFISKGKFKERYEWSNSNFNDIIDQKTEKVYKDKNLELCKNCSKEIFEDIKNSQDFFDNLDKSNIEQKIIEVDIFGYSKGQEKLSRKFREKMNYQCDICKLTPNKTIDRRYWHLHHKNGDKTNNNENNLQCLCILCHSHQDNRHVKNFEQNRLSSELKAFVKKYQNELMKLKNPYFNILKF